jgi:UDP-N-acetylglucosamine 2-epimerase
MQITYVIGARPNFIRWRLSSPSCVSAGLTITMCSSMQGQHDDRLVFLEERGVPEPDHMLCVGSASHTVQTARVMERVDDILSIVAEDDKSSMDAQPGWDGRASERVADVVCGKEAVLIAVA